MILKNYQVNLDSVSMERLEGETIIISFTTGEFYSTQGSGADVLTLLNQGLSSRSMVQILAAHYSNFEFEHSGLEDFILSLFTIGIIVEAKNFIDSDDFKLPNDFNRSLWFKPELQIHNEINGLLLVDPIHETNDEGWPRLKDE